MTTRARLAAVFGILACGPRPPTRVPESAHAEPAAPTATPTEAPPSAPAIAGPVEFVIEDAFPISGRGPVASGKLTGHVEVGDELVMKDTEPPIVVKVLAVEEFTTPGGAASNDVGLLLRLPANADISVLARGKVLVGRAP